MTDAVQLISRETIIATARGWLGTPYRHQGRKKGVGVDCIGLIWGVGGELGIGATIPANYSISPTANLVLDGCDKHLVKVEDQTQRLPGQVMILWGWERGTAQHFAVLGGDKYKLTMIHAFSRRHAVVEDVFDAFWAKRMVALYEFPNTEPWGA